MRDLSPWTILSSQYVVCDNWIRVRADHCLTEARVEVSPYYVLEYPDWVQVVALSPEGSVLLIEQYRHGLDQVTLELPAGRIEAADETAEAAGIRELREETGCAGDVFAMLPILSPNPATHANRLHTVVLKNVRAVAAPEQNPTEVVRTRWVSIEEALRLAASGAMQASLQLPSLFLGLSALGVIQISPTRQGEK